VTILLVAVGAAVGAAVRFHVATRMDGRVPYGTVAVNVLGSLLLGFLSARALGGNGLALLGTGFCGGLTTYSAFAVQTARLGPLTVRAVLYAVATVGGSVGAAALGFVLGA